MECGEDFSVQLGWDTIANQRMIMNTAHDWRSRWDDDNCKSKIGKNLPCSRLTSPK